MSRPTAVLAGLVTALAIAVPPALAQQPGPDLRIGAVDVTSHPDVRVDVALAGDLGRAASAESFSVTEDGEPREVVAVRQVAVNDLQVALVIDTSGSMGRQGIASARDAASVFLERLPVAAQTAVLGYDDEVEFLSAFGADRDAHRAAIEGLTPGGDTALFDAVLAAIGAFPAADEGTRQAIVLLSDGGDTASTAALDEVVAAIADRRVDVRAVAYRTDEFDDAALGALAAASGGSVVAADDPQALIGAYDALAAELSTSFRLEYRSEAEGEVELGVTFDRDGAVTATTRTVQLPTPAPVAPAPTVTPAPAPPERGHVVAAPRLPPRPLLYGGAVLWFIALTIIVALVFRPREQRTMLWGAAKRLHASNGRDMAHRATLLAERGLARGGRGSRLNDALERGGLNLRPGEYVVLTVCGMVTALAVGLVLGGFVVALLFAVAAAFAARVHLKVRISRRQARFADQLGATLQLLSGSLRAGYSFMQAVDAVAREADEPSAGEFSRVVVESRLGRDVTDALDAMSGRMQSEDFAWVVQAIEIHREVGGDLAEVLDTVAGTIRERSQVRRQVRVLSAEGRLSAWILAGLPFGVGGLIALTNGAYLADLTQTPIGWAMLGAGAVLMAIGGLWLRTLVRIEF